MTVKTIVKWYKQREYFTICHLWIKRLVVGVFVSQVSVPFYANWLSSLNWNSLNCCYNANVLFCENANDVGRRNENGNVDERLPNSACLQNGLFTQHNEAEFVSLREMWDGSAGMRFLLRPAVVSQLRVLYRSSSSGMDWPKSSIAGSGLKAEPPGGQQEKWYITCYGFILVLSPKLTVND